MAANNMGTTLILLIVMTLGAGVAGHEGHKGSAIKYWEKKLPGVEVPQPLREAVSPVEGSMLAGVFAMQIKHGLSYPSASASFCKKAGLVCANEKVDWLDKSAYDYKGAAHDKSAYDYKGAAHDKSAYDYKGAAHDRSAYDYKGAAHDKSAYDYKGAAHDMSAYDYKGVADHRSAYDYKGTAGDKSAHHYNGAADDKSAYHYKANDKSASTRKVDEATVPSGGYFLVTDLFEGATTRLKEQAPVQPKPFMPRVVADALPELKPENLHKLQRIFDIEEGTDMYNALDFATAVCDKTSALDGEDRVCPASLESFADFLSAHVGPDVKVLISSPRPRVVMGPMKVTNFTVHHSVDDNINVVICHILNFPSKMYMCHSVPDTTLIIEASMTDADGMEIGAVGICHLDTKMWTPKHQSFRILGIRPGTSVCHWNAQELLVFYGTNSKESAVIKEKTAGHAHGEMAMAMKGGHDHMGM